MRMRCCKKRLRTPIRLMCPRCGKDNAMSVTMAGIAHIGKCIYCGEPKGFFSKMKKYLKTIMQEAENDS